MSKIATVLSQKPSLAKKGQYLTIIDDGFGELRGYTPRKLSPGDKIVVNVISGAANDPLSVKILSKTQEESWFREHPEPVEYKGFRIIPDGDVVILFRGEEQVTDFESEYSSIDKAKKAIDEHLENKK